MSINRRGIFVYKNKNYSCLWLQHFIVYIIDTSSDLSILNVCNQSLSTQVKDHMLLSDIIDVFCGTVETKLHRHAYQLISNKNCFTFHGYCCTKAFLVMS